MGELAKKYANLAAMVTDKIENDEDFKRKATVAGVTSEQLTTLMQTLQSIDKRKAEVPCLPEFKRVHVGKLTVPVSFLRHIELLAKFAGVSEEAVWQLLMIETCQMYADRYAGLVDMLNSAVAEGKA